MITLLNNQDIFTHNSNVIIQQCNCFCTMGSGIAYEIRKRYPEAYEADCKTIKGDKNKLGKFSWVKAKDGKIIINMYSQYDYGRDYRRTNYEYFANGLERVTLFMIDNNLKSISIPYKIGCNLGGGSWEIIEVMINVAFRDCPFDVFICKKD